MTERALPGGDIDDFWAEQGRLKPWQSHSGWYTIYSPGSDCIVQGDDFDQAVDNARSLGIILDDSARGFPIPDGDVPDASFVNRVLNQEEFNAAIAGNPDRRRDWSDGWVWASIGYAQDVPSTELEPLAQVLASGDSINKAILMRQELESGVNRLLQAGMLDVTSGFRLRASGIDVFEHGKELAGGFDLVDYLARHLPDRPQEPLTWTVTEEDLSGALEQYSSQAKGWLTNGDDVDVWVALARAQEYALGEGRSAASLADVLAAADTVPPDNEYRRLLLPDKIVHAVNRLEQAGLLEIVGSAEFVLSPTTFERVARAARAEFEALQDLSEDSYIKVSEATFPLHEELPKPPVKPYRWKLTRDEYRAAVSRVPLLEKRLSEIEKDDDWAAKYLRFD